jgi:small subunit ribosomal protein S5
MAKNSTRNRGRRARASEQTNLTERLVHINRVAKVVKGGRRFSFTAVVVVGDGEGTVGAGHGKANEVADAIAKATDAAKKNMFKVPMKSGTVPHATYGIQDAAKVLLKPASHGTGVIAGGGVRAVLECAGFTDILTKSQGSNNPHNVVAATIDALHNLEDPAEVAQRRGLGIHRVFNG